MELKIGTVIGENTEDTQEILTTNNPEVGNQVKEYVQDMIEKTILLNKVHEDLDYWKERLGLQAWEIKIQIIPSAKMNTKSSHGEIWYQHLMKRAVIFLVNPDEVSDFYGFTLDYEHTLLHELLHLILNYSDFDTETEEDIIEEAINTIATTLVKLRKEINELTEAKDKKEDEENVEGTS